MEITREDIAAVHEADKAKHQAPDEQWLLGYMGAALIMAEAAGLLDTQDMPNTKHELARAALRRALESYRRL